MDNEILKSSELLSETTIKQYNDTIKVLGLTSLEKQMNTLSLDMERKEFIVVVVGEFNRGKSYFVNAIIGADIIPTDILPTTATINVIRYSKEPYVVIFKKDGSKVNGECSKEYLEKFTAQYKDNITTIKYIEIGYPADILKDGMILVDTPGVNDINQQRVSITYGFMPIADAVFFLLSPEQPVTKSEKQFLEQHILNTNISKLFFILNKIDKLSDEDEIKDALQSAQDRIKSICGTPKVYSLSSKKALEGKLKNNNELLNQSMLPKFEKELSDFINKGEKNIYKQVSQINRLIYFNQLLSNFIIYEQETLDKSIQQIEEEYNRFQMKQKKMDEDFKKVTDYLDKQYKFILRVLHEDLKSFFLETQKNITYQINMYKGDLKEYAEVQLPFLIEKGLKSWIEPRQKKLEVYLYAVAAKTKDVCHKIFLKNALKDLSIPKRLNLQDLPDTSSVFEIDDINKYGNVVHIGTGIGAASLGLLSIVLTGGLSAMIIPAMISGGALVRNIMGKQYTNKAMKEQKNALLNNLDTYLSKIQTDFENKIIETLNKFITNLKDELNDEYNDNIKFVKETTEQILKNRENNNFDIQKRKKILIEKLKALAEYKDKLTEAKALLEKEVGNV